MAPPPQAPFNVSVVRRSLTFYLAVFFIFAPMMMLSVTSSAEGHSTAAVLTWFILSGGIAVAWAAAFVHNVKFLFVVIPCQFGLIVLFAGRILPGVSPSGASISLLGLGSVILLILGYIAFVRFIAAEGTRALRLQTEMNLAQRIHTTLVPPIEFRNDQYAIVGRSDASSEMGGDLIDVHHGAEHIDVLLGDVSGHGVRAGVVMAMIKSALHTRLLQRTTLDALLADVNRVVCDIAETGMFATFFAARLHNDGRIEYINAGHPPAFHVGGRDLAIADLESDALPLGVMADTAYAVRELQMSAGDTLVLYTDGLTEVFDDHGEQLGIAGWRQLVARSPLARLDRDLSGLFDRARSTGQGPQLDDQSVILIRTS